MALPRVDDIEARFTCRFQKTPSRRQRLAEQGHVIAERLAQAAGLDEITLHIDDDECDRGKVEAELVRLGTNDRHGPRRPTSFRPGVHRRDSAASRRDR